MKLKKSDLIILILLSLAGLALRIVFLEISRDKPAFDQLEYIYFARQILDGKLFAHCCTRSYGYPLFIAFIYKLFGMANNEAVRIAHIVLSFLTGFMIFRITGSISKKNTTAVAAYGLYMLNPFTAGYISYLLGTEWSIFLIVLACFITVHSVRNKTHPLVWVLLGIVVGLFIYTRIALFWWGLAISFIIPWLTSGKVKTRLVNFALVFIGITLTSVYPLASNYHTFGKLTALPPYNVAPLAAYNATRVRYRPELLKEIKNYIPRDVQLLNKEFYSIKSYGALEKFYAQRKKDLINVIKKDPVKYINDRLFSMVVRWNKSHLFYYVDPYFPFDRPFMMTLNLLLIFSALPGFYILWSVKNNKQVRIFLWFTTILFFYLTVPTAIFSPEERYTIQAYPFLFILSAFFLTNMGKIFKKRTGS